MCAYSKYRHPLGGGRIGQGRKKSQGGVTCECDTVFVRQSRPSSTSTSTSLARTLQRLLHAPPVTFFPYLLPAHLHHSLLSFPFLSPLSTTAWASSLGHSIAFARQPRLSFALYWAPIRVSNQHVIVGMWISLAHSSSNLVSFFPPPFCQKWRQILPVETELCLD